MTYPNVYASQTGPLALSGLDANFLYAVDIANAALTATAGGTADAITATYSPAPAALVAGLTLYVRAASANATTTPQFSPNGLTGKVITKNNNQALAVGDIAGAGHWLHLVYDSTNGVWELINPATVVGAVQTGGTANGVAYLNGSKVLTTGTGFVFDGTNVGIGTTTPNSKMSVAVSSTSTSVLGSYANIPLLLQNTSSTDNNWSVIAVQDASGDFSSYIGTQNTSQASNTAIMVFATNGGTGAIERMRIESSGGLLVGTTSAPEPSRVCVASTSVSAVPIVVQQTAAGSTTQNSVVFYRNATSTGTIQVTGTTTAYNTSSDYRLKENVQPMTGALVKVAALKPCTYTWKLDGSLGEGFIAHELAEVVPQAVGGDKDAVDANGKIIPQGIDTSFLVATLTAAIQEQQALITALTARITALEAK